MNEHYICIKVYDANTTISVCEKKKKRKENTLPTEIVMPVEKHGLKLLKQNKWILPKSSKRLHYSH